MGIDVGAKVNSIRIQISKSLESLNDQVAKQRVNANINMMLGLMICTSGMVVMGYFIVIYLRTEISLSQNLALFLTSFLPKLTFVVLIETVGFFFLNLYREDRNMIRYFRNEITNLESRYIALEASARFDEKDALSKVLAGLASTERNFIIKKNERVIVEALREEESRLFDKVVDKMFGLWEATRKAKDGKTAQDHLT